MKYVQIKVVDAVEMESFIAESKGYRTGTENPIKGYEVTYADGYKSWCPKDVFDKTGKSLTAMTFGMAIECMKKGLKVARKGWNGENMYAVLMPGYPKGIEVNEVARLVHNLPEGTILKYRPYYQLWTAQHDVAMWSPSASDTLAEDWVVVDQINN